jgi:hypothetical protein
MRTVLVAALVLASPAMAQAISGTIGATFEGFQSGIPQVRVNVNLACTLTCDASAPVKHFAIVAGITSYFASASAETSGYQALLSTDLDLDGQASVVTTNLKPGSVNFLKATSATCHCGNRNGEGGFVDLTSTAVVVPPKISDYLTQRVGYAMTVSVTSALRGSEQIELKAEGAGVSQTKVVGVADVAQGMSVTPSVVGPITLTATMLPSGISSTSTVQILDRVGSGTGGGGASGTGGGSGGGGGGAAPQGCSTTGGGLGLVALALGLRRRRASRSSAR